MGRRLADGSDAGGTGQTGQTGQREPFVLRRCGSEGRQSFDMGSWAFAGQCDPIGHVFSQRDTG